MYDVPALQEEHFEFQKDPFPEYLLAWLMLECLQNSFESKLQSSEMNRKLEVTKSTETWN